MTNIEKPHSGGHSYERPTKVTEIPETIVKAVRLLLVDPEDLPVLYPENLET